MYLVVLLRSGPLWDGSKALEQQLGWDAHASFMDALVEAGFVVLGGPLDGDRRVVLVVEAASEEAVRATLGQDPWSESHLVVESVEKWTVRLDGRAGPPPVPTG
jgi:uncharacterized protein YciI